MQWQQYFSLCWSQEHARRVEWVDSTFLHEEAMRAQATKLMILRMLYYQLLVRLLPIR